MTADGGVEVSPLVSYAGEGLEALVGGGKEFGAHFDPLLQAGDPALAHGGCACLRGVGCCWQLCWCRPAMPLMSASLLLPPCIACRGSSSWPLSLPSASSSLALSQALQSTAALAQSPKPPRDPPPRALPSRPTAALPFGRTTSRQPLQQPRRQPPAAAARAVFGARSAGRARPAAASIFAAMALLIAS